MENIKNLIKFSSQREPNQQMINFWFQGILGFKVEIVLEGYWWLCGVKMYVINGSYYN
jgi:hypothetical protein